MRRPGELCINKKTTSKVENNDKKAPDQRVPTALPTSTGDVRLKQMVKQVKAKFDKEFKEFELKTTAAAIAAGWQQRQRR